MVASVGILDFGLGNLRNIQKGFEVLGCNAMLSDNPEILNSCDKLVIAGVGAFGECKAKLDQKFGNYIFDWIENKPILAVCVGMQILLERSFELGEHTGLGILKGEVRKLDSSKLPVPHMGWNSIKIRSGEDTLFRNIKSDSYFYFTHSYHVAPENLDVVAAYTDYGAEVVAAIVFNNIFATQFHPEKSQALGLRLLENFVNHCG